MKRTNAALCVTALALSTVIGVPFHSAVAVQPPTGGSEPDPAAVERTRKTIRMLDNIYKQAIVLITDKYVHEETDFPAGSAAVIWFEAISNSGSQKVRLIDVTGDPYDTDNVAKDAFEKEGVKQLKAGKDYYEQVVQIDGKPQLKAVTAVPVVLQKCVMCHPHYADVKEGAAIGAISYTLPIE